MKTLLLILPNFLSFILLFLPDVIYKISAKGKIHELLKTNSEKEFSEIEKLENKIKSNFDFISFAGSGLSLIVGLFLSIKCSNDGTYLLDPYIIGFLLLFIIIWLTVFFYSNALLNGNSGKQPGLLQKTVVIVSIIISLFLLFKS